MVYFDIRVFFSVTEMSYSLTRPPNMHSVLHVFGGLIRWYSNSSGRYYIWKRSNNSCEAAQDPKRESFTTSFTSFDNTSNTTSFDRVLFRVIWPERDSIYCPFQQWHSNVQYTEFPNHFLSESWPNSDPVSYCKAAASYALNFNSVHSVCSLANVRLWAFQDLMQWLHNVDSLLQYMLYKYHKGSFTSCIGVKVLEKWISLR